MVDQPIFLLVDQYNDKLNSLILNMNSISCFFWSKDVKIKVKYPRIIANDSALEKNAPPGNRVTVSLPAFIKSASTSFSSGYGPYFNTF